MKLSAKQSAMLLHVGRCLDSFDGYAPHHAGQHRTIHSLIKLGLVRFLSMGECGDGCERAGGCPHPVQIYTLTEEGHRESQERDRGTP